jgi:hypothetical protein
MSTGTSDDDSRGMSPGDYKVENPTGQSDSDDAGESETVKTTETVEKTATIESESSES